MIPYVDIWSHNTGLNFRRKSTRRHHRTLSSREPPSTPITLRPSLDTSTGIIAIRYSSSLSDTDSPTTPQSSGSSERSFYIESSPNPEDDSSTSDQTALARPSLPQRSASRRVAFRPSPTSAPSSATAGQERPSTPPAAAIVEAASRPPPIPPKSPYRASRAMIRLHDEMVGMTEDQPEQETIDERLVYELEG